MLRDLCLADFDYGLPHFADRTGLEVRYSDPCVMVSGVIQNRCYDFEVCKKRTVDHVDDIG